MEVDEVGACRHGTRHKMCDGNLGALGEGAIGEIEEWSGRTRRRLLVQRSYALEWMLG